MSRTSKAGAAASWPILAEVKPLTQATVGPIYKRGAAVSKTVESPPADSAAVSREPVRGLIARGTL